jgi:hypothetical protein
LRSAQGCIANISGGEWGKRGVQNVPVRRTFVILPVLRFGMIVFGNFVILFMKWRAIEDPLVDEGIYVKNGV